MGALETSRGFVPAASPLACWSPGGEVLAATRVRRAKCGLAASSRRVEGAQRGCGGGTTEIVASACNDLPAVADDKVSRGARMRDRHDDPSGHGPLPALDGVGRSGAARPAASVEDVAAVGEVAASGEVAGAAAVEAAGAAAAADPVAAISEALAAGAIDAETARVQLVEAIVAAQMPAGADPALWLEIRAEVEALLAGDPTLTDLLRV